MCYIGFTAAEFIENIFYMLDVELAEPLLYLGSRPLFLVYSDRFLLLVSTSAAMFTSSSTAVFLKGRSDMRAS